MSLFKADFACKKYFFVIFFTAFIFMFSNDTVYAQVLPDIQDLPIDPNALKNASPSDLQNYLKDYNQQNQKAGEDIHKGVSELRKKTISKDSTQKDNFKKKIVGPESVYGSNLFENSQILELSQLSTPPLDYPIGVGDHIIVSLWGGADFEQDYIVARDGSIFPQGLGKITVQGLTFSNARAIIYDRFKRVVPVSTNISVTLGQPRSIIVQVSGNVETPGPLVVSAFTNALNVIALAGGATKYGNLRNILISRNGKIIDSVDVYKYLSTGDFGKHLYLENNDFVIVPFYDKMVLATGQFKRPMYYQLKKGEGMQDLLKYSGGFTPDAYASGGIIIRNVNEKQTIKTVNFNAIGLTANNGQITDEPLFNGDVIAVNLINSGLSNKVIVKGEVAYPGVYETRKGDRLFDIINRAGGVTPNSLLERAYVYKGAGDSTNLKSEKIDVNLTDFNKNVNSTNNVAIESNDIIEIFNKNQFVDRQFVSIEGEVRKPGSYQKYGGMTLKDLLYFANGLKPSAEYGSIIVSSVVDADSSIMKVRPTKTIIKSYSIKENLDLDSITEYVKLKPYDQVFVRKNPAFHLQKNVKLEGEILFPGTYPKLKDNERLSSLIERAGGLKDNSNSSGAILYRLKDTVTFENPLMKSNRTRYIKDTAGKIIDSVIFNPLEPISIDLAKALKNKNSKYDPVVQEGDLIYVPEINPIVTIKGEVQSHLKLYFDKDHTNLSYYIDKAGGFGERPWRKRIYVTYANGKSKRTKNFGFFHFYPKVEEGSIVVVPVKPKGSGIANFASQVLVTAIPIFIAYLLTKVK
jgi:protein involved in polysaccharide export with SLBB domain